MIPALHAGAIPNVYGVAAHCAGTPARPLSTRDLCRSLWHCSILFMQATTGLASLLIESDTSVLMAAESSAMMGHRAAQQARQCALSLPALLCSCTLHLAPMTMRAHVSMPSRD